MNSGVERGFFCNVFSSLTGRDAFPWQERTFASLVRGFIPDAVSLPTGTGKTSLIHIWLAALAWQAKQGAVTLPRRLVWVVNRRVVVDQATEEAMGIIERLRDLDLRDMANQLATISLSGRHGKAPFAVSTLRGQLADNGDWKLDPSRPAIIIGTVDMIGSRLLFSGYGDGKYKRPLHAGLLGQDAWVVLDEAHLTPAFAELLQSIRREQQRLPNLAPWHVSLLSATQRVSDVDEPFTLTAEDEANDIIGGRLRAKKSLHIHALDEKDDELECIAQLALAHTGEQKRVIVFVKSPESAIKLCARIGKEYSPELIKVLTGTQRGFERDALARDPVFAGFRSNPQRQSPIETHYLIATAAGEVGADLDADHLVCDLAPLDSLIQRFGRVNRLGLGTARVDLVVSAKPEKDDAGKARRNATLAYLKSLPKDEQGFPSLSPAVLVDPPLEAFSATPAIVPLARHWLDMWSLTSIPDAAWPDRPDVAPWLHGVVDDLPETWVVWRDDIAWLGDPEQVTEEECAKALDIYPILPHEQLREPTSRIWKAKDRKPQGCKLLSLMQQRGNALRPVVVLQSDGSIAWRGSLERLVTVAAEGKVKLAFATLLLPTAAGGLSKQGMFEPHSARATDVADQGSGRGRRRFFAQGAETRWQAFPGIRPGDEPTYSAPTRRDLIATIAKAEELKPVAAVRLDQADTEAANEALSGSYILYFADTANLADSNAKSFIAAQPQPLGEHLRLVGHTAKALIEHIAASGTTLAELAEAFAVAGNGHDTGKGRVCWQRAIGNLDLGQPLA
jgi:CRISPR-associated endonuclease/helicase Cas3